MHFVFTDDQKEISFISLKKMQLLLSCPFISLHVCMYFCRPGSSVGIATGYRLDGLGIESQ